MSQKNRTVLMTGNEAMGEAAALSGCSFYAGYPITPQNELTAYMAARMRGGRRVFVQAESELAAINMVLGAAATGERAMTSSSSPGISLKQEGISYLAGAELPCVIINVMRGGPGLGNIASAQSDYFQATRGGGHGDYHTPVFAPASVQEAFDLVRLSFDVADRYRTPVLVLADAIIGQMMEPLKLHMSRLRKTPKPWALSGERNRQARIIKSFFLQDKLLERHNERLKEKWAAIRHNEQRSSLYRCRDARYLLVAYGSQARIVEEAVDTLRSAGIKAGLFRPVSLWPFPQTALAAARGRARRVVVIEQSLGQMVEDVRLSLATNDVLFFGKAGGGIPAAEEVVRFVKEHS